MTQIGWKYQELTQKSNIVLKLQKYTHIDTNLHKDFEKNWSWKNKNILYIQLKQYYVSGGPEMHAILLINKFAVAMVLKD